MNDRPANDDGREKCGRKRFAGEFPVLFQECLGVHDCPFFIINVIINDNIFPIEMQQETLASAGDKGFLFDRQTGERISLLWVRQGCWDEC